MNREEKLLTYLEGACLGRARCLGGQDLGRALTLNGTQLRKAVNRLRQKCEPIASDRNGYFYAQTAGEVYATIRNLKKMRAGLDAALQGLEQALDNFPAGR